MREFKSCLTGQQEEAGGGIVADLLILQKKPLAYPRQRVFADSKHKVEQNVLTICCGVGAGYGIAPVMQNY